MSLVLAGFISLNSTLNDLKMLPIVCLVYAKFANLCGISSDQKLGVLISKSTEN